MSPHEIISFSSSPDPERIRILVIFFGVLIFLGILNSVLIELLDAGVKI